MTDVAVVIAAVAGLVTAVGGLLLAFGVLLPILRNTRKDLVATQQVHTMVNQQRTDMMRYQVALVDALRVAGIDVPTDQSLGATAAPSSELPEKEK